jgi:hypothetical protein
MPNRVVSRFEEIPPIIIYAIFCIVGIGSLASEHEAREASLDSDKTSSKSQLPRVLFEKQPGFGRHSL